MKGLLPVGCCHGRDTGVLEVVSIVGWRLLDFRVGVCCLRRILHRRRGCILSIALASRHLVVVRVGFSTLLRHFGKDSRLRVAKKPTLLLLL